MCVKYIILKIKQTQENAESSFSFLISIFAKELYCQIEKNVILNFSEQSPLLKNGRVQTNWKEIF